MTCIAAVAHKGRIYMGADSAGAAGYDLTVRRDRKVFAHSGVLIGFTTSFRMGQVLAHAFKPPPLPRRRADIDRFMVCDFVDALRTTFKERGFASQQNLQEQGGTFLVGAVGRLFRIDSDYQVGEARDGFDAVGCGGPVALGALYAAPRLKPDARVLLALRAAERHNAGVRGPFLLMSL